MFESGGPSELGKINGKPKNKKFKRDQLLEERDINKYIKEAFQDGSLHYQRYNFKMQNEHFTCDPIGIVISLQDILNGKYKEMLTERTNKSLKESVPLQFDSRFESGNLAIAIK